MRYCYVLLVLGLLACTEDYTVPSHVPGVVKVSGNNVFVAYGDGGLIVTDVNSDQVVAHLFPAGEMNSIDDFDIVGNLLFVLDARGKNYLAAYNISNLQNPELIDGPYLVQGGPFNGISARGGNLVVSGGTFYLEYFQYSSSGKLAGSASFGRDRGHPDVLLSNNGQVAFASTDFNGLVDDTRFGVMSLSLGTELNIPTVISQKGIPTAGFTDGGTSPVGFPIQTALSNDNLLVAHGGGLSIIELVDDSALGDSRLIDLGLQAVSVQVQNDIAYVIGIGTVPSLVKVDISDTSNPVIIETVTLNIGNSIPTSLALANSFVYIAAGQEGLLKLNL
ncbi:MAG: hypothetical protein ABJP45_06725 [Cyclobacteriaceae bacterium]